MYVRPFIVWTIESSTFLSLSMDNVHGQLHYSPSIDNVHGRPYYRPSKTSSIVYHILVQETFLVSLVMIPDLVRSLGPGWSLWTNWRWTSFSLSHQLYSKFHNIWDPYICDNYIFLLYIIICVYIRKYSTIIIIKWYINSRHFLSLVLYRSYFSF